MLLLIIQNCRAQQVQYVPGSTIKIEQLIGDTDRQRKALTSNLTYTRYKLNSTDLGVPFTHKGKTYLLFGDAPPTDRDPIAYSADTIIEDGFKLNFNTDSAGTWKPITIPGVSLGAYEVPFEGVSWNNVMYIYACTQYNDTVGFSTKSIVACSLNSGKTFTKLYNISAAKFINISVVKFKTGSHFPVNKGKNLQFMFGSGKYRASSVYLAYQLADSIKFKRINYFKGVIAGIPQWSLNENDAVPLFNQPCVGELSVSYNKFIKKWIMLYNCDNPRGINCRTADYPWGSWSSPFVIFDPWADSGYCNFIHTDWNFKKCDSVQDAGREYEWGGEYAPYQFEDFAIGNATETTIYYTMSTWNPYTSVLMKSTLKVIDSSHPQFAAIKNPKQNQAGFRKQ